MAFCVSNLTLTAGMRLRKGWARKTLALYNLLIKTFRLKWSLAPASRTVLGTP